MTRGPRYCRHCGVEVRRVFGSWRHVALLGPVACPRADPEDAPGRPEDSGAGPEDGAGSGGSPGRA